MSKKLKVVWTENAILDLLAIRAFISQDSETRATTWISELYHAGLSLSVFAGRGRIVPEFDQDNIRELVLDDYRLVYRVKKETVEIITVFDGHRQLTKKDIKD